MKTLLPIALMLFLTGSCNYRNKNNDERAQPTRERNNRQLSRKDRQHDAKFAVAAVEGGMMEVQLADIALKNTKSSQVKEFAQTILDDHGKANEELKLLAEKKDIILPISLNEKNKEKVIELAQKKGNEFDKAYCNFMIDDHKADIEEFKKEAENGNDTEIKTWAAGRIQSLQSHLATAQSLDESVAKRD
ncbi:MAG TPA: DUF4142 domain-containing protein [Cyclobacteriaceae bacterium]|nr:DUF4142 domain-containing protein [Cyclobacteriaceae bacterium]